MKKVTSLALAAIISASAILAVPAVSHAEIPRSESSSAESTEQLCGWQTRDGKTYFYSRDGKMRRGWRQISSSVYYFGTDGIMRTGTVNIDGRTYDFGEDGKLVRSYTIIVNGNKLNTSAKPYYSGTSLMVPLKDISEALGYIYSVDKNGIITVSDDYIQKAEFSIGSDQVKFTGLLSVIDLSREIMLNQPTAEKGGLVYVPLDLFREFLNDAECTGRKITVSPSMCYID